MSINHNATLPQPAPAFGAVKGKNNYRRWALITPIAALFTALTIWSYFQPAFTMERGGEEVFGRATSMWSYTGILLTINILGGIVYLIYTNLVFTANQRRYHEDAKAGEKTWARTVVRDWLNERYGVQVTAEQAWALYDGWRERITHYDEFGRPEQVLVRLTDMQPIRQTLWDYQVRDIVNVKRLDPRLEIIEEPAKPRIYEWV